MDAMPFYPHVPKDLVKNCRYRRRLLEAAVGNVVLQRQLKEMCRLDLLFYVNTFCWTYRPSFDPKIVPFVTWEFQDEALLKFADSIRKRDLHVEKSRDMGVSWMALAVYDWVARYVPMSSFLLMSRKEELVDSPGNYDALMPKIDLLHAWQPAWLRPVVVRRFKQIRYVENGSVVDGESTTGDSGAGGRRTGLFLDEFARVPDDKEVLSSTRDVTKSRFIVSTPQGIGNSFHSLRSTLPPECRMRLHWTRHPEKIVGLYYRDGKPRSAAYDIEEKRCGSPAEMAQEWDIEYLGSETAFFDSRGLDRVIGNHAVAPYARGGLRFNPQDGSGAEFVRGDGAVGDDLVLWMHLRKGGEPPDSDYVVGCDVSFGLDGQQGTESVASIWDARRAEKVGEFATRKMAPRDFGTYVVALCRWLAGNGSHPMLNWETNGPGGLFSKRILELGYEPHYRKKRFEGGDQQAGNLSGWTSSKDGKKLLLADYRQALLADPPMCINHSLASLEECRHYVYGPNNKVLHTSARDSDVGEWGENHGDRVIADAVAWHVVRDKARRVNVEIPRVIPHFCIAARRARRDAAKSAVLAW